MSGCPSGGSHLSADQLEVLRGELLRELEKLERSMEVTEEGLRPVELDPGAVGRLSRIDELQNQALTENLHEREQIKLAALMQALRRTEPSPPSFGRATGSAAPSPRPARPPSR